MRVVTDSICDLPAELARRFGIIVVPLTTIIPATSESIEDNLDPLYTALERGEQPQILAPSVREFAELYTRLAATEHVVSIHVSSKLSPTYHHALLARQDLLQSHRITVIDSLTTTLALGMMAMQAAQLGTTGHNQEQIEHAMLLMQNQVHVLMAAESADSIQPEYQLAGPTQPLRSHLALATRPIIRIEEGMLQVLERVRTRSKGLERLYEFVEMFPHIEQLGLIYSSTPDDMELLLRRLEAFFPRDRIIIARCHPLLASQTGPGMVGVVVYEGAGY